MEKILKEDVCRIRPEYTLILTKGEYTDIPSGYIVVKRQLYYRLLNLKGEQIDKTIPIQVFDPGGDRILTRPDGSKVTLPRICELNVDKVSISMSDQERVSVAHPIKLREMKNESDAVEIYSEVEGLALMNDRALFSLTSPCYDLEFTVINEVPELVKIIEENVYLSSGGIRLRQKTSNKWTCQGGLLPGTALSVSWRALPIRPKIPSL